MLGTYRTLVAAGLLALAAVTAAPETTSACERSYSAYEKVVGYELVEKTYTRWVTVYDEYGCAHEVPEMYSRTVRVPVVRLVKVWR